MMKILRKTFLRFVSKTQKPQKFSPLKYKFYWKNIRGPGSSDCKTFRNKKKKFPLTLIHGYWISIFFPGGRFE